MYELDELIKTFTKHAEMHDKSNKENIRNFKENYPDAELPAHFKDEFNVSRALSSMCQEIERLKSSFFND